jgi:O-antigen/teichoic acid export membrane protein
MTSPQTILRKVAADSSLAFFLKVFSIPLQFLSTLVLARLYTAGSVGAYFIGLQMISTIGLICTLGLNNGLLRFTAAFQAEGKMQSLRRLFWKSLVVVSSLSSLAAVVLLLVKDRLGIYLKAPQMSGLLLFLALAIPGVVAIALIQETVRSLGGVRWVVFRENLLTPLGFLCLIIVFASAGSALSSQAAWIGLAYFTATLIGLGFLIGSLRGVKFFEKQAPEVTVDSSLAPLLKYSWPLFLITLVGLSWSEIDCLLLGLYTSPEQVAYYGVAIRIMALVGFPLLAVNAVVPPLFVRFYEQGDFHSLETLAQTTARWMYYLALPTTLLIILLSSELLSLFGPEFTRAKLSLIILTLAQLINVGSGSVGYILNMSGRQWSFLFIQILTALIITPLMVILAAKLGLIGVALAKGLGLAGLNILMAWAVWKQLKIKAFARKVQWANLGGLLGVAGFFLVKPFLGPIGGAICFVFCFLGVLGKSLWQELHEFFPRQLLETRP